MKLGFGAAHGVGWKILSMCSEILLFEISGHYLLWINVGRLIFQFPIPVILALLMNELRLKRYKGCPDSADFPQFLSWVIVASIVINILSLRWLGEQHHRCNGR